MTPLRSLTLLLLALAACSPEREDEGPNARGAGLPPAALPAADRAGAYAAALRQAFDVGPGLVLLLDTALLPKSRSAGARSPGALPGDVIRALRATGTVQGTCAPAGGDEVRPVCTAASAGYVVRVTGVFRMPGDSVQLYITAEKFRAARDSATVLQPMLLEQRYALVRRGARWTVAKKERLTS